MKVLKTKIKNVTIFEPHLFKDNRGFFMETWNKKEFQKHIDKKIEFVQDNMSFSKKNAIRGLHYQIKNPQGKLLRVLRGSILDVVVDLRKSSPTFSKSFSVILSASNKKILWIPVGCAHGFKAITNADISYKVTDYYSQENERCLLWNDPTLKIDWKIKDKPIISKKDQLGVTFQNAELFK